MGAGREGSSAHLWGEAGLEAADGEAQCSVRRDGGSAISNSRVQSSQGHVHLLLTL